MMRWMRSREEVNEERQIMIDRWVFERGKVVGGGRGF